MAEPKCRGCGHAQSRHVNGTGLCLVNSCRLCLIFQIGGLADGDH